MLSTRFLTWLLLATATMAALFVEQGSAHLVENQSNNEKTTEPDSFEELEDLNAPVTQKIINKELKKSLEPVESSYVHRDEDTPRVEKNLDLQQSLKYQVEIIESNDVRNENIELEERFKGNGFQVDTDTFISENIEVNGGDVLQQSHMILSIVLVIAALVSIAIYAALVMWRSHLEQRYGMRELLVTDDDYCQQNSNNHWVEGNSRQYSIVQL